VSIYGLLIFAAVYLVAVAPPGPGVAAVIARSLARGSRGAMWFIAGFIVGDLLWFTVAVSGLAAIAKAAYGVFVVLKYLGAAYLLYLAYKLWTTSATPLIANDSDADQRPTQLFLTSLTLTLSNPKTIAFFLALLPTVVRLDALTVSGVLEIAIIITIVLPAVLGAYVLIASRARRMFKSPRAVRNMNRGTGVAMASAAVMVATR
jgi:threonine/homoserine/homoserine lactone efflux protein